MEDQSVYATTPHPSLLVGGADFPVASNRVYCQICRDTTSMGLANRKSHQKTDKHLKNAEFQRTDPQNVERYYAARQTLEGIINSEDILSRESQRRARRTIDVLKNSSGILGDRTRVLQLRYNNAVRQRKKEITVRFEDLWKEAKSLLDNIPYPITEQFVDDVTGKLITIHETMISIPVRIMELPKKIEIWGWLSDVRLLIEKFSSVRKLTQHEEAISKLRDGMCNIISITPSFVDVKKSLIEINSILAKIERDERSIKSLDICNDFIGKTRGRIREIWSYYFARFLFYSNPFIGETHLTGSGESCPICLDEMEGPVLVTQCGHEFCTLCIYSWIKKRSRGDCPICRGEIQVVRYM